MYPLGTIRSELHQGVWHYVALCVMICLAVFITHRFAKFWVPDAHSMSSDKWPQPAVATTRAGLRPNWAWCCIPEKGLFFSALVYRGVYSFDIYQSPQTKRPSLQCNQALLNTVTYIDIPVYNIWLRHIVTSSCQQQRSASPASPARSLEKK